MGLFPPAHLCGRVAYVFRAGAQRNFPFGAASFFSTRRILPFVLFSPALEIITSLVASDEMVVVAGPSSSSHCIAALRVGRTRAISRSQVRRDAGWVARGMASGRGECIHLPCFCSFQIWAALMGDTAPAVKDKHSNQQRQATPLLLDDGATDDTDKA